MRSTVMLVAMEREEVTDVNGDDTLVEFEPVELVDESETLREDVVKDQEERVESKTQTQCQSIC